MSAPADAATSRWRQPRRGLLAATGFIAVLALVLGIWFGRALMSRVSPEPPAIAGALIEPPIALPDMILTQHTGEPLTTASFQGRWNLLFFGFASCPDVCPTTLQQLKQAMKTLAARNRDRDVTVWLISVDPERDTPKRLAEYVSFFDPAFRGATGSHAELRKLAQPLGVFYQAEPPKDGGDYYQVQHSGAIFVLNPAARLQAVFTHPHDMSPAALAEDFDKVRDYFQQAITRD